MISFEGLEEPNFERKVQRVRPGASGLTGVLLVEGFSVCGVEFHLHNLLKLEFPRKPHLFAWSPERPAELARVLRDNSFQLVVLANPTGGWDYQYGNGARGKAQYRRLKPQLDELDAALKAAVVERGATLVLFCAEKVSHVYGGLLGKSAWKEGCYVRTSCFITAAAEAALPAGAPGGINAKAIHMQGVPPEERWYETNSISTNNSILPREDLRAGLASVAAGAAGAGRVVFVGDVNAEEETCEVVQQLAWALADGRRRTQAAGAATAAGQQQAQAQQPPPQQPPQRAAAGAIPPPAERSCAACGANGATTRLLRCSDCRRTWYCSKACQRANWPEHKRECHSM